MIGALAAWRAVVVALRVMDRERLWKDADRLSAAYHRIVAAPIDQALEEFQAEAVTGLDRGWKDLRGMIDGQASAELVLRVEQSVSRNFQRTWNRLALRLTQAAEAWRENDDGTFRQRLREEGAEQLLDEVMSLIGTMAKEEDDPGFAIVIAIHAARIQRIVLAGDPALWDSELASRVIALPPRKQSLGDG